MTMTTTTTSPYLQNSVVCGPDQQHLTGPVSYHAHRAMQFGQLLHLPRRVPCCVVEDHTAVLASARHKTTIVQHANGEYAPVVHS